MTYLDNYYRILSEYLKIPYIKLLQMPNHKVVRLEKFVNNKPEFIKYFKKRSKEMQYNILRMELNESRNS